MASFLDRDGVLGTVGGAGARTLLELRRDITLDLHECEAEIVDVEHVGRERVATVVPLALVTVHADAHRELLPWTTTVVSFLLPGRVSAIVIPVTRPGAELRRARPGRRRSP